MRLILSLVLFVLAASAGLHAKAQGPDVTEIVAANDAFSADRTDQTRTALLGALTDYQGEPTVESVNAYLSLLLYEAAGSNSENLFETASAATAHLESISDIVPKQYLEARYLAAVARFNVEPVAAAMIEMAHVEGQARAFVDHLGEHPDWAESLKWKADAWGMAMKAYFVSAREDYPADSEVQAILASYGSDVASRNALAARSLDENGLPFCAGRMIQSPTMKYPSGRKFREKFGSVILGFDLNPDGQVINQKVLASVPEGVFDEKSLRVVGKWRFKPNDRRSVGVSCRLERTNMVQPLTFELR
jgi:TonB family protein